MSEPTSPRRLERINERLLLLADGECRAIIAHLRDAPPAAVSLETLAAALASDSPAARDRALIRLHHSHLPKLAATDIIKYDPTTTTVEYHGHPGLESLLEAVETIEATLGTE